MINNPFKPKIIIKGKKENIPNDLHIFSPVPVVFETKKQYVKELIKNQEKIRGIDFTPKQEKQFEKSELKKMESVIARYTTKKNPFMPPQTVFFTDRKITPDMMREEARHEARHYAWEPFDGECKKMGQNIPVKVHPKILFKSDVSSKNMTLNPRRYIGMQLGPKRYGHPEQKRHIGLDLHPKRYGMQIKPVNPNVIKMGPEQMRLNLNSDSSSKNMAWDVDWAKKEGFHIERMSPEDYLKKTNTKSDEPFLEKYSDFETHTSEPIEKLQEHIKNPKVKVHIPYIGQTSGEHEGRHRAFAVLKMGEEEIPVITQRPESHRTPEISEEFIKRQFPHEIKHETGYGNEWRERFKKSFPEERMDKESMKTYKDILKEKGLDKDPGKFKYEYESDIISKNMTERGNCIKCGKSYKDHNKETHKWIG